MKMPQASPTLGHVYGFKTKNGISLLQLVEIPHGRSLVLTRICDGFLPPEYIAEDVLRLLNKKELFFLELPLFMVKRKSKVYQQFFAFDFPSPVPETVQLPAYQRGYTVVNDGTVKWYKKRRGSDFREFVPTLTPAFLELSPDNCWSLPDLRTFLEERKRIADYI
jgi:hypothetical protein